MNSRKQNKPNARKKTFRRFDQFTLGEAIRQELKECVELIPPHSFGQAKMTRVTVVRYAIHQLWLKVTGKDPSDSVDPASKQPQANDTAGSNKAEATLDLDQLDNAMKESDHEDSKRGFKRRGMHVDKATGNACVV